MRNSRWPAATSDADFDRYLAGMPGSTVDMFHIFITMIRSCGTTTCELQSRSIVLCGSRRIFGSVVPKPDGLTGHLVLDREMDDPRITKVEPLTKRLYFHRWKIVSTDALEDTFRDLLCKARTIGDGG